MSGIFPICSGMARGFSRFVPFLFFGLLRAPTGNSPERVRDTIWTFPEKCGKPPGLETPRFSLSQGSLANANAMAWDTQVTTASQRMHGCGQRHQHRTHPGSAAMGGYDRETLLQEVSKDGRALQWASDDLKRDREVQGKIMPITPLVGHFVFQDLRVRPPGIEWKIGRNRPSSRNGEKMAQTWRKKLEKLPHFLFFRHFWAIFSPFRPEGHFLFFGQFFPIFGFRPIFHSIPGSLTRNSRCQEVEGKMKNQGEKKTKKQKKTKCQDIKSTHLLGGCLFGAFITVKLGIF